LEACHRLTLIEGQKENKKKGEIKMKKNVLSLALLTIILTVFVGMIQSTEAEGIIVVDGSLSDWIDLGISPWLDPDDVIAGDADLREFYAYKGNFSLYLAIRLDFDSLVPQKVLLRICIYPENSSKRYEVTWEPDSDCSLWVYENSTKTKIQNITFATEYNVEEDWIIEFSVPLASMNNPEIMELFVSSYLEDWMFKVDSTETHIIPEFTPVALIIVLITVSALAVVLSKKKILRQNLNFPLFSIWFRPKRAQSKHLRTTLSL